MMPKPSNLKALLVDFDGTLVNSVPALWRCYQVFLQKYGILAAQEDFKHYVGPSLFEIIKDLKERYGLPGSIEDLHREYLEIISRNYVEGMELFPGSLDLLQEMKGKGVLLALVTSAPYTLVHSFLQERSLQDLFHQIIATAPSEPSKPHSAPYRRALKELNVLPEEAIAIEDSQQGIASATGAGIYVIEFSELDGGWSKVRAEVGECIV